MMITDFLKRAAPLGLAAMLLAGCASPAPYAPRTQGQATGYTDRALAQNRYRVTFTGNSVTPRTQVEDYLLRRAAEVTLAAGYDHFVFDNRDTRADTRMYAFDDPFAYRRGFFAPGYWAFRPRWGYADPFFGPPVHISVSTRYEAYAEIVLLTPDQVAREPRALDARAIIAHMDAPPPPA